jgi:hypothetical protein
MYEICSADKTEGVPPPKYMLCGKSIIRHPGLDPGSIFICHSDFGRVEAEDSSFRWNDKS